MLNLSLASLMSLQRHQRCQRRKDVTSLQREVHVSQRHSLSLKDNFCLSKSVNVFVKRIFYVFALANESQIFFFLAKFPQIYDEMNCIECTTVVLYIIMYGIKKNWGK